MASLATLTIMIVLLIVLYTGVGLKKVKEHEQGVVTRFGKFMEVLPPGLQLVVPFVDQLRPVDLRTLAVEERIDPNSGTGKVRLWDEVWPARSAQGNVIGTGAPIKVVRLEGQYVVVAESRP